MTWQDELLIGVASTLVIGLFALAVVIVLWLRRIDLRRMALLNGVVEEVRVFMRDLTEKVGEDAGKSLAKHLEGQDDALEKARLLAEKKDLSDAELQRLAGIAMRRQEELTRELTATVARANENQLQWQKYMELLQKYTSQGIINNLNSPTTSTHTERQGGNDITDSTVSAGQDIVGNGKKTIVGKLEGVITEGQKEG